MIQGTTPTIRLKFPFDARLLETVEVNFIDGGGASSDIVLSKTIGAASITKEVIEIPLTQEETRLMEGLTTIEVRAKTKTGGVVGFRHVPKYTRKTVSQVVL